MSPSPSGTRCEDDAAFLRPYRLFAKDGETWAERPKSAASLELAVSGHHEVDRHTHYTMECKLVTGGRCTLEWMASRRLTQIREQLHSVLKKQMGPSTYAAVFSAAPFAKHGAPAGTTGRLDRWCKALAESVNAGTSSPATARLLLEFLDVPEPSPGPVVASRDAGLELFQARRRLTEELDKCEEAAQPLPKVEATPVLKLAVDELGENHFKLHGLHEDTLLKIGLGLLDSQWGWDDAQSELSPRIISGRLIAGLLRQERDLKSMPVSDVAAAQGDLKLLSLRQLLRIRVWLLDYEPQRQAGSVVAQGSNTHAAFMSTLDAVLFQRLGAQALSELSQGDGGAPDTHQLHRLGVELIFIVAAANSELAEVTPLARWWVWWLGERRLLFDAETFCLTDVFPSGDGALEVEEKSRVDARLDGKRRAFEWNVERVRDECCLRTSRAASCD